MITVLAALVVFLAAMAGYLLWRAQDAAAAVTLEPTNSAAPNPFMPPQGPDASVPAPPGDAGGAVAGSTPGLFGGSLDNGSCNQDQMAEFLATHQDKAEAWAEVQGVATSDIPAYVHQLTPLVLRADTSVTNHGFRDGELTSYPAVLQAGTAVLVDGYGTPRVKCYCGNPLSAPPEHRSENFVGQRWARFAPVTVIVIEPAPVVVENLTVINIQNNTVINKPLPPWHWGRPPGWKPSSSSGSSSSSSSTSTTDTSSTDTSSSDPSSKSGTSNRNGGQLVGPGTGCVSPQDSAGVVVTTTPAACGSATSRTTTTSKTTTTTTPTTTTTTTTTTTSSSKKSGS
ncbi:DUF6777 domain-containing protein [Actinomycetospora sp. TBRC 11914]|uniref:DUF6777 domain-containing protein n=1 Tax=Actinomycetospora sp. TBRC 11914 TaxID=2729387 RepID=UPI00145D507D|nr:DUF6777 domain-containing protein [Actinomycetospora sp. TBRC 11914]NMO90312.1 hypothetical protein [Actinomycetospora sp. TBRC 11914]